MPKLRLKRTAAEEAERERKKARKSSKREHKKRRTDSTLELDEDEYPGPQPSSSKHRYDDDDVDHHSEGDRFAEKLRDAMEDDAAYDQFSRLDSMGARMNDYSHIPRRWRGTEEGFSAGLWMEDAAEEMGVETWRMNDDEYSEYVRAGMYRFAPAIRHLRFCQCN